MHYDMVFRSLGGSTDKIPKWKQNQNHKAFTYWLVHSIVKASFLSFAFSAKIFLIVATDTSMRISLRLS